MYLEDLESDVAKNTKLTGYEVQWSMVNMVLEALIVLSKINCMAVLQVLGQIREKMQVLWERNLPRMKCWSALK